MAAQKARYAMTHRRVLIDALAKKCFLIGVNITIQVMLMQKNPATLIEANKETMQLEWINETTSSKNKTASLSDLEDTKLVDMTDELGDLANRMINTKIAKYGHQPFQQGNRISNGNRTNGKGKCGNGQSVVKCQHCNREGHMQLESRTRITKNALCGRSRR
jgi:hypothetical protein